MKLLEVASTFGSLIRYHTTMDKTGEHTYEKDTESWNRASSKPRHPTAPDKLEVGNAAAPTGPVGSWPGLREMEAVSKGCKKEHWDAYFHVFDRLAPRRCHTTRLRQRLSFDSMGVKSRINRVRRRWKNGSRWDIFVSAGVTDLAQPRLERTPGSRRSGLPSELAPSLLHARFLNLSVV